MKGNLITLKIWQPLPDPIGDRDNFNLAMDAADAIKKGDAGALMNLLDSDRAEIEGVTLRTLMSRRAKAADAAGDDAPEAAQ